MEIPKANPYIQFLTSDSGGNIWFAEERGNALGVITHSLTTPTALVVGNSTSGNNILFCKGMLLRRMQPRET